MLKKTITYEDFNGNTRTEDFYFNLTQAEVVEMQLSTSGGFDKMLTNIINAQDEPSLIKEFKKIIKASYGVKSSDGRKFIKNDEVFEDFASTEAYAKLFVELATNDEAASEFVNGIMPKQFLLEATK